jgi:gliding motility-associated-like protein
MKRLILFLSIIIISLSDIYATHNRAGQIVYKHISGYTYEVTIWTYTYALSAADRDSLEIQWGDGTSEWVGRVMKHHLPDNYIENKYVGRHTYPGPGTYQLVMEDPNRNEGVLNIPNSVNVVFALTTTLQINPFVGHNSAAILTTRPIDKAAKGQIFIHNPGAYDPDGDSLSYRMDTCRYNGGQKIPGFTLPPASDSIYVDPVSGDLIWNTPTQIGIYNVAMRIEEWRNGIKISSIIRDIQIEVEETDNNPPQIDSLNDLCVVAGEHINFDVSATDPDNDIVYLTASGGPFQVDESQATFPDSVHGYGSVTGTFDWQTICEHVAKNSYVVSFKATDDNPEVPLVNYNTIKIKVIGPAVQITDIEASNTNVILKWQKSNCKVVTGYKIYRRNDTENFNVSDCQTGIPDSWGYQYVTTVDSSQNSFVDVHLNPGFVYCYRIVPVYYDDIDGQPSDKQCVEIAESLPILTKASVITTATDTGSVRVEWIKPISFDTLVFRPPYRFLLSISRDLYGVNFGDPIILNSLDSLSYDDNNIDTKTTPSCYKLALQSYDSTTSSFIDVGYPTIASTPFARIISADKKNDIYIDENVPWDNDYYVIYRYNENTSTFDSIGYSTTNYYRDAGLQNLKEYCYYVKSISHYTADSVPNPIINFSQIVCGSPLDTVPPCCPEIEVTSECDEYRNKISWKMPADSCYEGLAQVKLYYSSKIDGDFELIATLTPTDTVFYHSPDESIAGCYYASAIDSAGNISECQDKQTCIDICEYYKLPNIFTPNADNTNDLYHPYPYKFVDHIDMKIYNRWGNIVFQTEDPDINWDGTDINSGKKVADGVYYYICDVYEYRLNGIQPRNISGFIHIYSQKAKQKP